MMIGTTLRRSRSVRQTSYPSGPPPSATSSSTTSKRPVVARSIAARPSATAMTRCPSRSKSRRICSRSSDSSSTTRMSSGSTVTLATLAPHGLAPLGLTASQRGPNSDPPAAEHHGRVLLIGFGLAIASSLALNAGYLLQHVGGGTAPAVDARRPVATVRGLLRSPLWVVGMSTNLFGSVLHIGALAVAPI